MDHIKVNLADVLYKKISKMTHEHLLIKLTCIDAQSALAFVDILNRRWKSQNFNRVLKSDLPAQKARLGTGSDPSGKYCMCYIACFLVYVSTL